MKKNLKHIIESVEPIATEIEMLWKNMIIEGISTEEELELVTELNGYTIDTLNHVLKVRTGYNNWNEYKGFNMKGLYNKFVNWVSNEIDKKSEEWTNDLNGKKLFNQFVIDAPDWFTDKFAVWCKQNNYNEDIARGELGDNFNDVIDDKLQEIEKNIDNKFNWDN